MGHCIYLVTVYYKRGFPDKIKAKSRSRDRNWDDGWSRARNYMDDSHSTSHIMKPINSSNHVFLSDTPHHSP